MRLMRLKGDNRWGITTVAHELACSRFFHRFLPWLSRVGSLHGDFSPDGKLCRNGNHKRTTPHADAGSRREREMVQITACLTLPAQIYEQV